MSGRDDFCEHGIPEIAYCAKCALAVHRMNRGTVKQTNPKDAVGVRKVPFLSVLPLRVIGEVALAMLEGARKYGRHNYRPAGVRASVYMDAVGRHLGAWYEGQDIDPGSGLSHITKAIAGLVVLRDSMMHGNWEDDRPPAADPVWIEGQNAAAEEIIDRYPDAKPPHTAVQATSRKSFQEIAEALYPTRVPPAGSAD